MRAAVVVLVAAAMPAKRHALVATGVMDDKHRNMDETATTMSIRMSIPIPTIHEAVVRAVVVEHPIVRVKIRDNAFAAVIPISSWPD